MSTKHRHTLNVFISYAHRDKLYFEVFLEELKQVVGSSSQFEWEIWTDHELTVGDLWHEHIQKKVQEVNAAILLVSPAYLNSNYAYKEEFKKFVDRKESHGFMIFPILFLPSRFENWEDLQKMQLFMPEGRDYGCPEKNSLAYGHLLEFTRENQAIPNTSRFDYILDFVGSVEEKASQDGFLPLSKTIDTASGSGAALSSQSSSDRILQLVPEYYKYACDRIIQRDEFHSHKQNEVVNRVHFYCVHGIEAQSPLGISKRFYYELTRQINDLLKPQVSFSGLFKEIEFTDSREERLFKINLVNSIFAYFSLDPDVYAPTIQSNLGAIVSNSPELKQLTSDHVVTVYMRIIRNDWREFIPDVLQWFICEFCKSEHLPENSPSFYFFISVIYEDIVGEENDEIIVKLSKIEGLTFLSKLDEVQKMYVTEWLRKHRVGRTSKKRKELFQEFFDELEAFDMEDIEIGLEDIINKVNLLRSDRLD